MEKGECGTAIYLAGHGTRAKPRLIELQYRRILRYRSALLKRHRLNTKGPLVFVDLRLPAFGLGHVDLDDVPQFQKLYSAVQAAQFDLIFVDLDETERACESTFVRSLLEAAGATVLNAFTDDRNAFAEELKARCGPNARDYEVTDGSDLVNFFPSLSGEIVASALLRELESNRHALQGVSNRIERLKRMRPYSGGATQFVESDLSLSWKKLPDV